MSEFVTQAKYAEIRGVSPKTVNMWKNQGWLVFDEIGRLVDVKASDAKVKKYRTDGLSPTPILPDGRKRINQYDQAPRTRHTPKKDDNFEDDDGDLDSGTATLQEAKRVKENYFALQAKLEYEIEQGKYIDLEEAKRLFFEEARKVRDAWINWPIQVVPHIAAELDVEADKLLMVLNDYVYQHLKDLGNPTFKEESEDD